MEMRKPMVARVATSAALATNDFLAPRHADGPRNAAEAHHQWSDQSLVSGYGLTASFTSVMIYAGVAVLSHAGPLGLCF
jgi:hypothetical protein